MGFPSRKILSGLVLLGVIILAVFCTLPPHALPTNAPANEFSAERAIKTIQAITSSPRLVGSPAYEDAKVYLLAQLTALGLETDVQSTNLEGVSVENVLGRLEGSESTDAILLSAHLDSVSNSPGATDDGSGVAEILETVRALQAESPLRNAIIVLFTGPEENCCYGAQAFVTQHPWAKDVRLVVNVDAGGLSGPSILAATGSNAGWLTEEAAAIIPHPIVSSAIEALGSPATDYTLMFRKAGWLGFDFNISWNKSIHSPLDNINNLNPASIQDQGEHVLAVVRHFGNLSLEFPKVPSPIYFDVLGLTMLYYPTSWAIYILLIVTLVFVTVIYVGFRRKSLTFRGIGFGAVVFLLSLITTPLLLAVVQFAMIQPSLSVNAHLGPSLMGETLLSKSIRWGSMIFAVIATFIWYVLFSKTKKVRKNDLAIGAYFLLYLGAFASTVAFPAISYLFVWPLLFGLIATFFWFLPRKGMADRKGWPQFLGLLVEAAIAVVMFIPGVLIAVVSIDIRTIYFVPILLVVLLGFLILPSEYLFSKNQG